MTEVSLSATLTIAGNQVTVNSGDITKLKAGAQFTLSQPVQLGSVEDFTQWLDSELGLHIPDLTTIQIPIANLQSAFTSFVNGVITLTTLVVDTNTSTFDIGVTFTLEPAVSVLGLLQFDGIGILVNHSTVGSPN
jgi:hypothetical protein